MKEVEAHIKNDHWVLIKSDTVAPDTVIHLKFGQCIAKKSHDQQGYRSQGWVEHPWWQADIWCQLF